jgi:hypothetical protein
MFTKYKTFRHQFSPAHRFFNLFFARVGKLLHPAALSGTIEPRRGRRPPGPVRLAAPAPITPANLSKCRLTGFSGQDNFRENFTDSGKLSPTSTEDRADLSADTWFSEWAMAHTRRRR